MRSDQVADVLGLVYEFEWRERAYCRFFGPRVFFACETKRDGGREQEKVIAQAKGICRLCEVSDSCLAWAVAHPNERGVWGNTTYEERVGLRRRAQRALRARVRSEGDACYDESLEAV